MVLTPINRSLRIKITLAIVLPLILILGLFTAIEYNRHRRVVLSNLSILAGQSGRVVEANLRHAMLQTDFDEVQIVLDTLEQSEVFEVVYLLDPSGEIIFSANQGAVGTQLSNTHPDCQPCHSLPASERPQSVVVEPADSQRQVFRSMQPILNQEECTECHDASQRILGLLLTDISMEPMEAALQADLRENAVWWGISIFTTMVIVNFIINQFVLKRLKRFTPAIVGLGDGCLPEPIYDGNSDEIAHLATAFNTMANQVRRRETENERLSTELRLQSMQRGELFKRVISAQEDERKRVARELHDGLGQALSGLSFQAEAIEHLVEVDPERTRRQLQSIRSQVAETTRQMYDLIFDLRPSTLDDMGLVVALRAYAERLMKDHDIQLQLRSEGLQQRMPIAVETSLYRIYQEALTNIVRHAHASQVRLTLSECQSMFTGKIIDNGIGFDPLAINATGINKHGLGLLGMQERVAGCDGTLNIQSHPGCGTRILIRVPLQRQS